MSSANDFGAILGRRAALARLGAIGTSSMLGCSGTGTDTTTITASLGGLTLSAGTLSPAFDAAVTTCTVSVANAVAAATITPVIGSGGGSIKVNGTTVATGAASTSIALAVGTNTITIVATGTNGATTRSYSIVVTRASVAGVSCVVTPDDEIGPFPLSAVTIFPGWYNGRITHIHVELFLLDNIGGAAKAITQVCFPPAVTTAVYSSALYTHGQNTSVASIEADHVFSDGYTYQLVNMSGSVAAGYTGMLTIGVNV